MFDHPILTVLAGFALLLPGIWIFVSAERNAGAWAGGILTIVGFSLLLTNLELTIRIMTIVWGVVAVGLIADLVLGRHRGKLSPLVAFSLIAVLLAGCSSEKRISCAYVLTGPQKLDLSWGNWSMVDVEAHILRLASGDYALMDDRDDVDPYTTILVELRGEGYKVRYAGQPSPSACPTFVEHAPEIGARVIEGDSLTM
jgi:hypothetical protein